MPLHDRVICGDSREVLKTLDDASCDAVITDPPYALTQVSRGGSPRYNDPTKPYGRHRLADKGFMGQQWDNGSVAHDPAFWAEVLRVAKPGAHLVAFGGTRTAHRLACAIEDAGWEIRDSLYLLWCHGQGFPKSLDISKAIDKMAGADRDVVGLAADFARDGHHRRTDGRHARPSQQVPGGDRWSQPVTIPSSDDAKQWDGWGTALKPSAEPIVLARKPLAEPTVAANVLAHGTGALHIDACRVPTGESLNGGAYAEHGTRRDDGWGMQRAGAGTYRQPPGRWPPNTILSHVGGPDGCQPAGVRRVRGGNGVRGSDAGNTMYGGGQGLRRPTTGQQVGYADADGRETVSAYHCVDGCPVKLLDEQAGPRPSGGRTHTAGSTRPGLRGNTIVRPADHVVAPSVGNCSRFFPTFAGADPEDAVPFRYEPKASRRDRGEGNTHSTVKPTALMAWLCKLVTPPGGTVLDCFAGSGSTLVACVREGFGFIGIEQDSHYCDIARGRIAHARAQLAGPLFATAEKDA